MSNSVTIARDAILDDLAKRYKQGDKTVIPAADTTRFYKPQRNYFAGDGEMPCPICNGKLRYSRSARNGHVHGRCLTAGCVAWME